MLSIRMDLGVSGSNWQNGATHNDLIFCGFSEHIHGCYRTRYYKQFSLSPNGQHFLMYLE